MARLTAGSQAAGSQRHRPQGWRRAFGALAALLLLGACSTLTGSRPPAQSEMPSVSAAPLGAVTPAEPQPGRTDILGRPIDLGTVKVALLLPLSGPSAEIGTAMLNAAQMAVFEVGNTAFELMPRDTTETPEGAAAAATDALANGARLILGPLFAQAVGPAGTAARSAGINVIAFSTDASVAGGNVLVMGFLPGAQVDRVVAYGRSQGIEKFAVLAPDDAYGRAVAGAMRQTAAARGATLSQVELYDPSARDYSAVVRRMASGPPFDALMLPDSGVRLRQVASLVPYYGLRRVRMLGTGVWDGQNVGAEPALVGAWYAAPQPDARADFENRYTTQYGARPPRVASLAYDAVALAATLARQPGGTTFDFATLTDPSGFAGVDGIFRFGPDGLVQRGLAVMEVTATGAVVRDPAPTSFAGASF